ncbi:hypothetical protein FRC09_014218 [Ceratobasidium sp. 395]|nr:hypothetical protein FRC09_014218 [Ceratobasidium sp. 395]
MRFAVFATLFAYATIGLLQLVSASPILDTKDMVVKRDNSDIHTAVTSLKQKIEPICAEIDELVKTKEITLDNVTPLLNDLKAVLDDAAANHLKLARSALRKRQTDNEIAQLIADLLEVIANTLNGVLAALGNIPALALLLAGIDASLAQVLIGLGILLAGVLNLVATLLVNVAALLRSLAFGLTLGALGLPAA